MSDGTHTSTHLEAAALLLTTHVTVNGPASDHPEHDTILRQAHAPYRTREQDVPFSQAELWAVVCQMRDKSAPSPDDITLPMVEGLVHARAAFLLWLFNASLRLGHFTSPWHRGRIIFIWKPGRLSELTTSYRPICVNSILGKVLECLLNGRLYFFLHQGGHIHPRQYGFMHGRSAVLAQHQFHECLL
ncbi:hypothetical protein MRX96_005960 [Rhipicephalus microplus]